MDYRDGHLIVNRSIGQRFVGKRSTEIMDLLVEHMPLLYSEQSSHLSFLFCSFGFVLFSIGLVAEAVMRLESRHCHKFKGRG